VDPFVAQLHQLCRDHRTRAKWVVVPRHALGHTLGERLAREGTSWANLRVTPPYILTAPVSAVPVAWVEGFHYKDKKVRGHKWAATIYYPESGVT